MSHYLAPPVVKTNGEAGAVGLHVALGAVVPVDPRDAHGSGDIHQAAQPHLHLDKVTRVNIRSGNRALAGLSEEEH